MFQILGEILAQVLIELGVHGVAAARQPKTQTHPALACFGYLILGIIAGALSVLVFSKRRLTSDGLAILGVFLNPLIFGWLSSAYGSRRARLGKATTHLGTFWGGVSLAFGFSAARLAVLILAAR